MFVLAALTALISVAQAAVSGDYCYTDTKICGAFADSGYTFLVTNESHLDRHMDIVPNVDAAYIAAMDIMCEGSKGNMTECKECFAPVQGVPLDQILTCFNESINPNYTRIIKFVNEQGYMKNSTMVTIDPSRVSCYMNLKAQMVFGSTEANRTFTKPAELAQSLFGMWMFRVNMLVDFVENEVTARPAEDVCRIAGQSEVLEMAGIIEFFGLSAHQLKEELTCRCRKNLQ